MNPSTPSSDSTRAALREHLTRPPQGTLESVAEKFGVTLSEVLVHLPEEMTHRIDGTCFADLMGDLAAWGEVLVIIHTRDGVFECKTAIQPGSIGSGYFNLEHGAPLSGHLRHDRCREIFTVERSFHGKRTCSIWFMNSEGGCMFKVFVARDAGGELLDDQVSRFQALPERFSPTAAAS